MKISKKEHDLKRNLEQKLNKPIYVQFGTYPSLALAHVPTCNIYTVISRRRDVC